jgi:hypothetical protein
LEASAELQAKTLFQWLQRKYPGRFQESQLRTFQRGVKSWRATRGPGKEVFFAQRHHPGRLCASDFTHMTSLGVTIEGQPFEHLVYHFVLTYSNWEWATVCFSESFESLSEGLQESLWELGGVPERHRSDRLSAAVNNLSDTREFTQRYAALMAHYGLASEKIGPAKAHENGDVESLHRHFKRAVEQALLLRGSCEFVSRAAYADFLRDVLRQRNAGRAKRWLEERGALRRLPADRRESCKRLRVRVNSGSLICIHGNRYSVSSRLIGEQVEVRVQAEQLSVWYGQHEVDRLPRLRGRSKHYIQYRHVIDWLLRKPAFANYRYREDLFPTSRFRIAYDHLRQARTEAAAAREYLAILALAARQSESGVDDALRVLLARDEALSGENVQRLLQRVDEVPTPTVVSVDEPNLSAFDELFSDKEAWHGNEHGCEERFDGTFAGTPFADVSLLL